MFFTLSKLVWFVLEPLNLMLLLLLLATLLAWAGRYRAARAICTTLALIFIAVMLLPVGNAVLIPLEQRFPPSNALPGKVDGIILLGGAQQPRLSHYYRQPVLNGRAETMTTFLALARHYPRARLVFSGGSGDILHQEVSEAETVRMFLVQQGFDADRVVYESRSRNTFENAVFSKLLVKPKEKETWLLVASASSLPRAVGVFRRQHWNVTPVPCDYRTLPTLEYGFTLSALDAFNEIGEAEHEWLGLAAYYATGKIDTLFPGP